MDLKARSDGGGAEPWLHAVDRVQAAATAPTGSSCARRSRSIARSRGKRADFVVTAGELLPLVLEWAPSHHDPPVPLDSLRALADT